MEALGKWLPQGFDNLRRWWRNGKPPASLEQSVPEHPVWQPPRIGLALGGGFARGVSHCGVLKVIQEANIPLHCITGVSAGSIVAAAYASGADPDEIGRIGASMRFGDIARWTICKMGFMRTERMNNFLARLLKKFRFEEMQ